MITLKEVTTDFLRHCKVEKNLSAKTITAYQTDLTQWLNFLKNYEAISEINSITKEHLRSYLESISTLKVKSIKRKIATLKALFNFLEFEDQLLVNPFRKMKIKLKESKVLPTVMSLHEISRILKQAYKEKEKPKGKITYSYVQAVRNIAILELLFATGARVSEIAGIKNGCIDTASGNIVLKGKGNKERVINVCNQETLSVLSQYSKLKDRLKFEIDENFFINRLNKPLTDQSIRNFVKKIAIKAGISKRITPHVFRHSFATLLLERDVDIKYIQALLGHSSIITTQIYTHVSRTKQRQILRAKHPRRDLIMIKE